MPTSLLLIDDDERITAFVKRGMEAEGFQVETAHDGEDGLRRARAETGLILLDVGLPGKNGIEICRTLRQERITTPILMLTAKDAIPDKVEGLRAGADDYLAKPFAFDELLARIQALLRRGPYHDLATQLQVDDLILNRQTREVARGIHPIDLTEKEYALLEYLMSNPNKPLSRTMIIDHVWGYHHHTVTNVVNVYIRYLRNKIDLGHRKPLIHTIRDIGYKISGRIERRE